MDRQFVWVGPEATSFEVPCEACLARKYGWSERVRASLDGDAVIAGTLRREADVGFTTCRCGHRVVVRRVGRTRVRPHLV